ncbi:MAG: hypothetical protein IKO27_09065 [Ruminococcus sp.]|nr:hypothetical protein [Ruminococcus sp.]
MKKYAIYKSETGYYAYEYFETLEELKGTMFDGIVTEDKLPVVLDGEGGYFHFTGNDYMFDRLVECEGSPLELEEMYFKNMDDFKLGWMSPEGDTYSCDYTSHTKAAVRICEKFYGKTLMPERALGKRGWLKIIDSWDGTQREHGQFVYSLLGKVTKRQADKLFDLGLYNNEEVRKMIADCEDTW